MVSETGKPASRISYTRGSTMAAQSLANADTSKLALSCSMHLDTHEQNPTLERRRAVTNPDFVSRVIKMNALFCEHLLLRDSHVLDHLGVRHFLLRLDSDPAKYEQFVEFARTPGPDGLGPLLFASTPLSPSAVHDPFPLRDLFRRQLGLDPAYEDYDPWELSSVWEYDQFEGANAAVRQANGEERYQIALRALGPPGQYERYLQAASLIWDEPAPGHALVTRIPRPKEEEFKPLLEQRFAEIAAEPSQRGRIAERFLKEALPNTARLIRGPLNRWLREQGAGQLQYVVGEAYHMAFLRPFRSPDMWLATDKVFREGGPAKKRTLTQAAGRVAAELPLDRAICIDELDYARLAQLRRDPGFQESLRGLTLEWRECHDEWHLLAELQRHAKVICERLAALGMRLRRADKAKIAIYSIVPAALTEGLGDLLFLAPDDHLAFWKVTGEAAVVAVVAGLFAFLQEPNTRRDFKNLAKQVGEAAFRGNESDLGHASSENPQER
jgi:hypothetical protein